MKQPQNDPLLRALAVIAVSCLVVITVVLVRNAFFPGAVLAEAQAGPPLASRRGQQPPGPPLPPVEVEDWDRVASRGHRIGAADAPVTIVEFSDFECPACRRFATETFPALEQRFPGQVALLYRHYPLRSHAAALPAARAAECAAAQSRFEAFHDVLFAHTDSMRAGAYRWLARQAKVPDQAAFERCNSSTAPVPAIEADMAEVRRIGGSGTPTLVINGLLVRPPYSPAALAGHVETALGKAKK